MEYNTERNKLIIKEYGRNVQKMIEYAIQIEDRELRNEAAKGIVKVMSQINPEVKESSESATKTSHAEDYWNKLWDHLYIISNYQLDIDAPFPKPEPVVELPKVKGHQYYKEKISFKTYGRHMEQIVKVVSDYPLETRLKFGKLLANHLKKLYLLHNRNSVKDILIIEHLKMLSNGKIELPETTALEQTRELIKINSTPYNKPQVFDYSKKKKKKKKKPSGSNGNNNFNNNYNKPIQNRS
ncbi:MAG TPA: DUF4290 domain-containing protein [Bacteroidales bacterium]|nr:DUF4290 domain-containing protein [Bacteroidales bacterium]